MPELPDVEVIRRRLLRNIQGKKILNSEISFPKLIRKPRLEEFKKNILDLKIIELRRRGKYLLFLLEEEQLLIFHLGMSGDLIYLEREEVLPYNRLKIFFEGKGILYYNDKRKFGKVFLIKEKEFEKEFNLGIEPLDREFTFFRLKNLLENKRENIKRFLLNQKYIAGIGNIYASEILFHARISPFLKTSDLSFQEIESLFNSIKKILKRGISLKELKAQREDRKLEFMVYQRRTCPKCYKSIEKVKLGGRSTYFCGKCQM
jgi:formamidopyrimidine-DNA glycosylase